MKRLTERDEFGNADIIGVDAADLQLNLDFEEMNLVTDALNRLAAYEETGLTLKEAAFIAKALEQDRIAILPDGCRVTEDGHIVFYSNEFTAARRYRDFLDELEERERT